MTNEPTDNSAFVSDELVRCPNCRLLQSADDARRDDGLVRCDACGTVYEVTMKISFTSPRMTGWGMLNT